MSIVLYTLNNDCRSGIALLSFATSKRKQPAVLDGETFQVPSRSGSLSLDDQSSLITAALHLFTILHEQTQQTKSPPFHRKQASLSGRLSVRFTSVCPGVFHVSILLRLRDLIFPKCGLVRERANSKGTRTNEGRLGPDRIFWVEIWVSPVIDDGRIGPVRTPASGEFGAKPARAVG
ncbi:hypothetical protein H6P81_015117 [Aristolochia fimbriata]|uniref:Uncharacterized protein n=1 Tax=Aristolochia fimbriata TaxID=158543 RepID=A0AAV7E7N3_ARIFI|nr:hypothetical protein H6P81_015117 [Aristolochia fimbriata]